MFQCEYRHPLRFITFRWVVEDGIVRIVDYTESEPIDPMLPSTSDLVILPSDLFIAHQYPCLESDPRRTLFELNNFVPEYNSSTDVVKHITPSGLCGGTHWSTLLVGKNAKQIGTHVIADIEGALTAMPADERTLLCGKSGSVWWIAEVHETIHQLHVFPIDHSVALFKDFSTQMDMILDTANIQATKLVFWGDSVTPPLLVAATRSYAGRFTSIERFQPFHQVRSSVSETVGQRILSRAHILGCFVGAAHSFSNLKDTCITTLQVS